MLKACGGKVVLVDFWTFTCIDWRRTLPYLRAWGEKYKDQSLVIVGVHTPEFGFEKDLDNVCPMAEDQNVDYLIAVDSAYGIWRAFDIQYLASALLHRCAGAVSAIASSAKVTSNIRNGSFSNCWPTRDTRSAIVPW